MTKSEGSPELEPDPAAPDRAATAGPKAQAEVRRRYDFGIIRALRQQKGLSIEKFAQHCGLSYAPISKIETNQIKPNLDTLDRIAEGLNLSTYSLLAMAERRDLVRHRQRECKEGGFNFRVLTLDGVELALGSARRGSVAHFPWWHAKDRIAVFVAVGALEIKIGDRAWKLAAGEGAELDCLQPIHYLALEDSEFVLLLTCGPRASPWRPA